MVEECREARSVPVSVAEARRLALQVQQVERVGGGHAPGRRGEAATTDTLMSSSVQIIFRQSETFLT